MTTPEQPDETVPQPNETTLRWLARANECWPDSVPVLEMLIKNTWVDPGDGRVVPEGLRIVGFGDRGRADRGPLLSVVSGDAVRAFEGALYALPRYANAPVPIEQGALTKALERKTILARLDELVAVHERSMEHLTRRLAALEQKPLPADVRVLEERIGKLRERVEELEGTVEQLEQEGESMQHELRDLDQSLVSNKREVTRRFDRLEGDVSDLERRRR